MAACVGIQIIVAVVQSHVGVIATYNIFKLTILFQYVDYFFLLSESEYRKDSIRQGEGHDREEGRLYPYHRKDHYRS